MYLLPIDGITCNEFKNHLGKDLITTIEITEQELAKSILDMTGRLVPFEFSALDVRRKVRIWRNDELRTICIDELNIFFNGKMYKYEGEIRDVLEGLIEENDAKTDSSVRIVEFGIKRERKYLSLSLSCYRQRPGIKCHSEHLFMFRFK